MSYQQAMYDREHPRYSEPTEYITMEVDGLIVALRFKNAVKIEYGLDSSMILQSRPYDIADFQIGQHFHGMVILAGLDGEGDGDLAIFWVPGVTECRFDQHCFLPFC